MMQGGIGTSRSSPSYVHLVPCNQSQSHPFFTGLHRCVSAPPKVDNPRRSNSDSDVRRAGLLAMNWPNRRVAGVGNPLPPQAGTDSEAKWLLPVYAFV